MQINWILNRCCGWSSIKAQNAENFVKLVKGLSSDVLYGY